MSLTMANIKYLTQIICTAILTRYPLWKCIGFVLFVADYVKSSKVDEFLNQWQIYAIIWTYFFIGILSSYKATRLSIWFLIMCSVQFYVSYKIFYCREIKYDFWIKVKICTYTLGTNGIYMFLSSLITNNSDAKKFYDFFANIFLCVYFALHSFIFLNLNQTTNIFLVIPYGLISLSFLNGLYKRYAVICALCMVVLVNIVYNDIHLKYWTSLSRYSVHYWMQINLLVDNICLVLGLVYMLLVENYKISKQI